MAEWGYTRSLMLDLEGTFRSQTPRETLAWITPLLKEFGITRVADVTGLDSIGVHVYQAIRPLSKSLSVSQGKGMSRDLAKISAMMESIETWHAENTRPPDLYGSYLELCNTHFLANPLSLLQEIHSEDLLKLKIYWIQAKDLLSDREIYVPYTLVHLDMTSIFAGAEVLSPNSNGLASGNTREEALCHAIYEVIERDSWVEAKKGSLFERSIDLDTIDCPHLQQIIDRLKKAGVTLLLLDITSRLQIPSYAAYIFSGNPFRSLGHAEGYGTHLSKKVAASRAITEAVQSLMTIISGARDDLKEKTYQLTEERRASYNILRSEIQKRPGVLPFSSVAQTPLTFSACLEFMFQRLREEGFEQVIYFDHTLKEWNVPVVRILVPGLQWDHR